MIEQASNSVKFLAFYTASKVGKTGLTVTVNVYNPAGTLIVNGGSASEIGDGIYSYILASGSTATEGEYVAVFKTTDGTVDQQHIPALWIVGRAGVEHLDANVTSRPTAAQIDTQLSNNHSSGSWASGPSAVDIDNELTASHGAGNWTTGPNTTDIANAVNTTLTTAHGVGAWTAPTVGAIDAQLTSSHGSGAWTSGPNTTDIANAVDTKLTTSHGAGSWQTGAGGGGGAAGSGADQCTMEFTDDVSGDPIADADVWVTSDEAGTIVVAGTLQTKSDGTVTFLLDAGVTYYMWMQKDGANPIKGREFVAAADV